jgi:dihydroorotate dehydrogenase
LRDRADRACARLFLRARGRLPIIGVGGIFTAQDAYRRIRAGASLVQIYTALVYEGPGLPRKLCAALARLLRRDGIRLADAVGADAEALAR